MSKNKNQLSPEVLEAMRCQYDAMGFEFGPGALSQFFSQFPFDAEWMKLAPTVMSPAEIAKRMIAKCAAVHLDQELPKCVSKLGETTTYVRMPLDDLRFAHRYLALIEARAEVSMDQTRRALNLTRQLSVEFA
jgi:hypothetical protein